MTIAKRRPKGSGTIAKTSEGEYRALFAFTPGHRQDIDGSPFATYEEAEHALDVILATLRDSGAVRGGITLRQLGRRVLDRREKDGYRSVGDDRNRWASYWLTWDLSNHPAKTITRGDVRQRLSALSHLATQTRRNALNVLRAVFAGGVDDELIDENPCDGIKIKDHGSTIETSTWLSSEEASRLIDAASDPAVALAIGTGMRSGELRSLLWEDVHANAITVRFGSPGKPTKKGKIRTIPILPIARAALDALPRTHKMVLPSVTGEFRSKGRFVDAKLWKEWKTIAKIARRVRPHDLRHTTATLLLTGAWGRAWTYEEVKEMLGHSSVKVTERYARATGTLAELAARDMHRIRKGSGADHENAAQALEMIQRRGWDSDPRVTVLQFDHKVGSSEWLAQLQNLSRSFIEAVHQGSPFAIQRGLELADFAWPEDAATGASGAERSA